LWQKSNRNGKAKLSFHMHFSNSMLPQACASDRPEEDAQTRGAIASHHFLFVRLEFSLFVLPVLRKTNVLN